MILTHLENFFEPLALPVLSFLKVMNSANPFQIPSCFQSNLEQRRRERFKKAVIATIAATVLLLVGLLIEGCKSERASAAPSLPVTAIPAAPEQKLPSISPVPQTSPAVVSQPASSVSKTAATPVSHSSTVYVVKSGDTLTRIAKLHGVTVKAIISANDLASDRITVGAKLKIPSA